VPDSDYHRRIAGILLRLWKRTSDAGAAATLLSLAAEHQAMAQSSESDTFQGVFEPEEIEAMAGAFAMACERSGARDTTSRESIAIRIVTAARLGDLDPRRLSDKATIPVRRVCLAYKSSRIATKG
jgi:hypothetical protein